MKTNLFKILFTFLLLNLDGYGQMPEVKIGTECPDVVLKLLNHSRNEAKISDFRGKLLILDFWATWCVPCISDFPKIDSLQKKFGNQVQILPVGYESKEAISLLLKGLEKNKNLTIPSVVEDLVLKKYFPHSGVPFCVWIDKNGKVIAMTDSDQLNEDHISRILRKESVTMKTATQTKNIGHIGFDNSLFYPTINILDKAGKPKEKETLGDEDVYFKSILTTYREGFLSMIGNSSNRISLSNVGIEQLYMFAFLNEMKQRGISQAGFGKSRRIWEVRNKSLLEMRDSALDSEVKIGGTEAALKWKNKFGFCYEIQIPTNWNEGEMYKAMQDELNRYFGNSYGINGSWEKRRINCLALIRTDSAIDISTKGEVSQRQITPFHFKLVNKPLVELTVFLNANVFGYSETTLIDETGFGGNVDLEVTCDLKNISEINRELSKYGLKFVSKSLDTFVITFRELHQRNYHK